MIPADVIERCLAPILERHDAGMIGTLAWPGIIREILTAAGWPAMQARVAEAENTARIMAEAADANIRSAGESRAEADALRKRVAEAEAQLRELASVLNNWLTAAEDRHEFAVLRAATKAALAQAATGAQPKKEG